jgi:hypothetical protein
MLRNSHAARGRCANNDKGSLRNYLQLHQRKLDCPQNRSDNPIVLTRAQLKKYMDLDQKGNIMAEYVWIDATGGVRSKSKVSSSCLLSLPLRRFSVLPRSRVFWSCAFPHHGYTRRHEQFRSANRTPVSLTISFRRLAFVLILNTPQCAFVDNAPFQPLLWLRIFCTLPILAR